MNNLWTDQEAAQYTDDLALRVYTSRLLGRDKSLVLHGGGNTSVKLNVKNVFGEDEEILYVKGSGWDLEKIEKAGFSPVKLEHARRLAQLPALSDPAMVNELVTNMTNASAPVPSVEAILHAILPYKFVDHTHADAVLAVSNSVDGEARIRAIYGDLVVVIPYVMPGFDLARRCATLFAAHSGKNTIGMVLLNHGIFSFGDSAKESYDRMIRLVGMAEAYLQIHQAWSVEHDVDAGSVHEGDVSAIELADLRNRLSKAMGSPMLMVRHNSEKFRAFGQRADLATIAQQGPATPDHVIRTKRIPLIGRDVDAYVDAYRAYFNENEPRSKQRKTMLDPAPRVVLDPVIGLAAVGRSAKDAAVVAELYDHTVDVILRATALGGFRALPASDIFEVEYWDLEQAKLKKSGNVAPFGGEVALVTGAASGIGKACVEALLARGAAVVGVDLNPAISGLFKRPDFLGLECDLTSESAIRQLPAKIANAFGGLDMLILNAGIFPGGCDIANMLVAEWQKVMRVNLDANLVLLRECYPLLKLAPKQGRVVVVGSKNVAAPGPGAAAYSASKAALNQLVRVAALEWGRDGIRINTLHPNAVFDTGIWSEQVLQSRAQHYGLTVDAYKKNNVLQTEITSRDVAELAAEMCGPLFAKTTAAQVPIDGGNDRVI